MKFLMNSSAAHEKCHSFESLLHFVHEFLSELEYLNDDVQAHNQSHQKSRNSIRKIQSSSSIDFIPRRVIQAAMSPTIRKNLYR